MPKRALVEKRPWLLASLVTAIAYYVAKDGPTPGLYLMALKGLPVALLAVWALLRHAGNDTRTLAGVMALGAIGDMLMEIEQSWGAMSFLLGHFVALILYLRHPRAETSASQKALAGAVLIAVPLLGFLLPHDRAMALPTMAYAAALAGMAAAAWMSSFPRYRVGIGAMLFVASDLLIFAEMGALAGSVLPGLLIWPLYYCGQFMICTGVVGSLRLRAEKS